MALGMTRYQMDEKDCQNLEKIVFECQSLSVYVDDDDEHRKADGDGVRRNNFVIFIAG